MKPRVLQIGIDAADYGAQLRQAEAALYAWAEKMERMRAVLGARASTAHVSTPRWVDYFTTGAHPSDAVLDELLVVAD